MNKSKKYADQAASMLKKHCKKKTNKLVYNEYPKLPRGHCQAVFLPKISKSCGTRIRYCTAKELKMMNGPRLCDCPNPNEPFKATRFLKDMMRNAIKAAIVLGAAYITYDLGFWGVPRNTQATFAGICEAMPCRPDPCKSYEFKSKSRECEESLAMMGVPPPDPCECDDPIPINMEKCCHKMKQVWNHTIIFIFEGIANAPDNVIDFIMRKWREGMSSECDPCRAMISDNSAEFKNKECVLIDDYDEKYSKEEEDECKETHEQVKAFLEAEEEGGDDGGSGSLPPCGY